MTLSRFSLGLSIGVLSLPLTLPANADPILSVPVFCFRITDVERALADPTGGKDRFLFEFEVLNWTNQAASGLRLVPNVGGVRKQGSAPVITAHSLDPDGRGGTTAANGDIGVGTFDPVAIHSGRGRADVPALLNDWNTSVAPAGAATWDAPPAGTPIPNVDLLAVPVAAARALVPGVPPFTDALGDSAVDGGPGPYAGLVVGVNGSGPPAVGTGNVLDGFVIEIDDFDVGERISFNWFLTDAAGLTIGVVGARNAFGFGVFNLARIAVGGRLPGARFKGNTGFQQGSLFFDSVFSVPNPAEFGLEFGAGITAPFLDPTAAQDLFGFVPQVNTHLVPEPQSVWLFVSGLIGLAAMLWRRRRRSLLQP